MTPGVPPLEYLLDSSNSSLKDFLVSRLNAAAMRRKDVQELLPKWIEATAQAMLAEWFVLYGEALVLAASANPEEREAILAGLRIAAPEKFANLMPATESEAAAFFRPPRRRQRDPRRYRKFAQP